jgi:hypothetical protein
MFFVLVPFAYAQAPAIEWEKSLGGSTTELAESMQKTTDGGYIVTGMSSSTDGDVTGNHGGYDYWVVKLSGAGSIEWERSLGGTYEDDAHSIHQTLDSGYILAGNSASGDGDVTGHEGSCTTPNYWIVKLSPQGDIQWEQSLGIGFATSIVQANDGGYVIVGDNGLIKLTGLGDLQWQMPLNAWPNSLAQTSDGGYVVAGSSSSLDSNVPGNHGGADYWVAKYSNLGVMQWQKSLGGSGDDYAFSIEQTTDGGCIVNGQSNSTDGDVTGNHGADNYWVVNLDSSGNIQWEKSLGGTGGDFGTCATQTSDSGYIVGGMSGSTDGDVTGNHGGGDYWIVKLNSSGNIQWEQSYGGSSNDQACSIAQTVDGGYILAGSSESTDGQVTGNHGGSYNYWVVKLGHEGSPNTSKVNSIKAPASNTISISNYPDPFSSSTLITIPGAINPTVSVADLMGREIAHLQSDGSDQFIWDPDASVSNGTYFILAQTSTQTTMKPVVIER